MANAARSLVLVGLTAAVVLCVAAACRAQDTSLGEINLRGADSLADLVVQKSKAWIPALQSAAKGLFAGLALIQLGWIGVRSILLGHGKVEDALGSMVWEVVQLAFFALLIDKGPEWGLQIIDSLQEVGRRAAETATRPQDLLNHANDLCQKVLEEMSVFDGPVYAVCMGIGLLLMFLAMICIATFTLVGWAQAFIVLGAGTIVLGLGGSVWTRSIAAGYLRNALAAGLKLMTLELIASIVYGEVEVWIEAAGKGFGVILLLKILGSCVLTLILILSVPSFVASMVTAGGVMSVGESMLTRGALALAAWKGMAAGRAAGAAVGASGAQAAAAGAGAGAQVPGMGGVGARAGAVARAGLGGPLPSGGGGLEGGGSAARAYAGVASMASPAGVFSVPPAGAATPGRDVAGVASMASPAGIFSTGPAGGGTAGRGGAIRGQAVESVPASSGAGDAEQTRVAGAPRSQGSAGRPAVQGGDGRTAGSAQGRPARTVAASPASEGKAGARPSDKDGPLVGSGSAAEGGAAESILRHGPAPKPQRGASAVAPSSNPATAADREGPHDALGGAASAPGDDSGFPASGASYGAPSFNASREADDNASVATTQAGGMALGSSESPSGASMPRSSGSSGVARTPAARDAAARDVAVVGASSAAAAAAQRTRGADGASAGSGAAPARQSSAASGARAPAGSVGRAAPTVSRSSPASKPAKEKIRE